MVVVVVVVVLATVAESAFVSGSTGTTGDGTAALLLAIVVVVAWRGAFTTLIESAKSGSVINITTERSVETLVILPTRPAAFNTGIPTRIPLSLPWLISIVCEKFDGESPIT